MTDAGLCADCVAAKIVATRRGSEFVLCRRSETDPAFPRYPRLPMLSCPGYQGGGKVVGPPDQP